MEWLLLIIFCILLGLAGITLLIVGLINKNKKQYTPGIALLAACLLLLIYLVVSAIMGLSKKMDKWSERIDKHNNTENYYDSPVSFNGSEYYFWDEKPLVIDSNETNYNGIFYKDYIVDFDCDSIFLDNGTDLSILVSGIDTSEHYNIWFVGRNMRYENPSTYSHTTTKGDNILLHYTLKKHEHFDRIVYLFIEKQKNN